MAEPKAVNKIRDLLHLHERRDLDAFIAKEVMNWKKVSSDKNGLWLGVRPGKSEPEEIPYYHNDMGETRYVINKIQDKYPWLRFCLLGGDVGFNQMFKAEWFGHPDKNQNTGERLATTYNSPMELAVCLSIVDLLIKLKELNLK